MRGPSSFVRPPAPCSQARQPGCRLWMGGARCRAAAPTAAPHPHVPQTGRQWRPVAPRSGRAPPMRASRPRRPGARMALQRGGATQQLSGPAFPLPRPLLGHKTPRSGQTERRTQLWTKGRQPSSSGDTTTMPQRDTGAGDAAARSDTSNSMRMVAGLSLMRSPLGRHSVQLSSSTVRCSRVGRRGGARSVLEGKKRTRVWV